jgi:hypothetical protein
MTAPLTDEELSTITRLSLRHDAEIPEMEALDRYYEGTQPLQYMHPEILREVAPRIRPVIIFWPQMVVDSVEERLRLEGFKTGDKTLDKELWRVWKANRLQLGFREATVDSLVMRRSYLCVGTNEEDPQTPLVTPESPLELFVDTDPRTRRGRAALRRVTDTDESGGIAARYATLYLPNETIWCTGIGGGWKVDRRDRHNLGRLPIASLVNRGRLRSTTKTPRNTTVERQGRSDLDAVIPLSDGACKLATDMLVAGEFVAIPLRALFGVDEESFKDTEGRPVSVLKAIMGRMLTIPDEQVKAFEFAAAQLQNFTGALSSMATLVASVSGLPPHYLGMSSDNPASAEAIAGSEARLATRAERKQDALGVGAIDAIQIIRRFQTGDWDPDLAVADCDWRNVRTPTVAAMADAAQKLFMTTPRPIVPLRQTREKLGFSEPEIEAMEAEDEKQAEQDPIAQIARAGADQRIVEPAGAGGDAA